MSNSTIEYDEWPQIADSPITDIFVLEDEDEDIDPRSNPERGHRLLGSISEWEQEIPQWG